MAGRYDFSCYRPFPHGMVMERGGGKLVEDLECIRRCQAGERDAYEHLVRRYSGLVWSLALHHLQDREEAADVVQEVFLKAYAALDRFLPEYPFKAWISRITLNHCINTNRKRKWPVTPLEEAAEQVPATFGLPEADVLDAERRQAVNRAVQALPDMYRVPIVLYHQHDMSYEDICRVLQLPMTIVKNRLYRARKLLARSLAAHRTATGEGQEGLRWTAQPHGNG